MLITLKKVLKMANFHSKITKIAIRELMKNPSNAAPTSENIGEIVRNDREGEYRVSRWRFSGRVNGASAM